MKGNLLGLLGICRKAGKLKLGFDPAVASLGRDAQLLLFTTDISPKTRLRMLKKAEDFSIKSLDMVETADAVYNAIGKRVAVMAITDKGLAQRAATLHNTAQHATQYSDEASIG
ncbi:MAG: L7Ae/L30e/S12e/Gadd45 family ribosomal protein [Candidatus Fimivivens sp.]